MTRIVGLVVALVVVSCTPVHAQNEPLSASNIVTMMAASPDSFIAARASLGRLARRAPTSARADSVVNGLVRRIQSPADAGYVRSGLLGALRLMASSGNLTADEHLWRFAETQALPPSDRASTILQLVLYADRQRAERAWVLAARDTSDLVATQAIELLSTYPSGLAALRQIVDRGELRSGLARSRVQGILRDAERRVR